MPLWELFSDRERIQRVVEHSGPLAPVVYVLLLVVQAVVLPLPAPPLQVAGGYVFGAYTGFVLAWLGILIGGAACFGLARLFGREFAVRSDRVRKLDRYIEEHGAVIVFVVRLIPVISFDAVSYAAGLSGIPFWKFLVATALGMAPSTFALAYLGGASPGWRLYLALGGVAALAIGAYLYLRRTLGSPSS